MTPINDLGIPQLTRIYIDPAGETGAGLKEGLAVVHGPAAGQCTLSATGAGRALGVARYSAKHNDAATIQTEGFAEVESAGAVAVGAEVFIADAGGRVGAAALGSAATTPSGQGLKLGVATSATDAAGERLSVDLASRAS